MAVVLTHRWRGLAAEDYERVRKELMQEGPLPDALRLQVVAVDGADLVLTEVWASPSAADEFRTGRLAAVLRDAGVAAPEPSNVHELHRVLGPAGRPTTRTSRRILVVAHQTLGSEELEVEIRRQAAAGPCLFHLLVPAPPIDGPTVVGEAILDPLHEDPFVQDELMQAALEDARDLLDEHLHRLRHSGIDATGEVGMSDPMAAVRFAIGRRRFDEVILSTLPSGASRWLGMDLPSRLRRTLDVPLTVVTPDRAD